MVIAATGVIPVAAHAAIVDPAGSPLVLRSDGSGHVERITIVASGFPAGSSVFIEQCDGVAESTPNWSPVEHCDLGSSPAPVLADANGVARFDADDRNHAFLPFVGESPQSLFNCVADQGDATNNGLPTFTNCRVRVSSNNTAVTADQSMRFITLPANAVSAVAPAARSTTSEATSKPTSSRTRKRSSKHRKSVTTASDSSSAEKGSRRDPVAADDEASASWFTDPAVGLGFVLVLAGAVTAGWSVARRRRATTHGAAR
jgi:hypothetical protein